MKEVQLTTNKNDEYLTTNNQYYLCVTNDIDYLGFFKGNGKYSQYYSEIIVLHINNEDSKPFITTYSLDDMVLDSEQVFYGNDIFFELTDDEVLKHIVAEII